MIKLFKMTNVNKLKSKLNDHWLKAIIIIVSFVESNFAFADSGDPTIGSKDIGEIAQKVKGQVTSLKSLLWSASQVAGIIMAIVGLRNWYMSAKNEDGRKSVGTSVLIIVIGALMFFLPQLMGVSGTSIFG